MDCSDRTWKTSGRKLSEGAHVVDEKVQRRTSQKVLVWDRSKWGSGNYLPNCFFVNNCCVYCKFYGSLNCLFALRYTKKKRRRRKKMRHRFCRRTGWYVRTAQKMLIRFVDEHIWADLKLTFCVNRNRSWIHRTERLQWSTYSRSLNMLSHRAKSTCSATFLTSLKTGGSKSMSTSRYSTKCSTTNGWRTKSSESPKTWCERATSTSPTKTNIMKKRWRSTRKKPTNFSSTCDAPCPTRFCD